MSQSVQQGSVRPGRWAAGTIALVTVLLALVAAFNALVDPTAQLGTGALAPVAAGPRDREAKVELLERALTEGPASTGVVVLGSSRTKKLDPAWLGAPRGVNAAVVGGDAFEARVLAAWIADLVERRGEGAGYPQLVVGVDVEQLRDSSLQGSGFLDVPRLATTARREAAGADGSLAGELDRLERLLLTWQVTKASLASVRSRARDEGRGPAAAGEPAVLLEEFTTTGVPRGDARWSDPAVAERRSRDTTGGIERNVRELRGTYERIGARFDPDAVGDLRALVEIVRGAGGSPPLLYVTPAHPALDDLDGIGRADRRAALLDLLRDIADDGRSAVVVDCSRCIDEANTSWLDATHPSPLGMRQLASALSAQAPSATPTERSGASR